MLSTGSSKMEKPNRPGKIGFFFLLMPFSPSASQFSRKKRIHLSFFYGTKRWWVLIKTILVLKLKCKICHFTWLSFLHVHRSVNPDCGDVLKLLFTPLLLPLKCIFLFLHTSYSWHGIWDSECQHQECEVLHSKGCYSSSVPSGAEWMPAGRTLDEEEKGRQEKASAGIEGKMEWRSWGGWYKNWKKRCQLIKHVQLRDRVWRKG